jgi:TRAP-type C4-dicarboxylate transport system substrate-binding protein
MGGEKDNLEALKLGELDIGVFGTFPIVTLAPKYSFFDAPFVFRDKDHVYKTWNSKLGDGVRQVLSSNGIHTLGMMGRGYRHITSNQPINTVDDLKGVKIRMGQSKPFIDAFSSIGAVVVPIALPELFTSLKLGVVSASDGPVRPDLHLQAQEAQKNLAITGHLYATSLWLMNDAAYKKLSAKQRETFDQAVKEAVALWRRALGQGRGRPARQAEGGRHAGDEARLRALHGQSEAGDRQAVPGVVVGHHGGRDRKDPVIR